jgi:hypothetical protein
VQFRHAVTAAEAQAGSLTNGVATATGGAAQAGPTPATQFSVTKAVTGAPANGTAYEAGEHVVYDITVANGGTQAGATDVVEALAGEYAVGGGWAARAAGEPFATPSIAAGAAWSATFRYRVTAADAEAGKVDNGVSTATGGAGRDDSAATVKYSVAKSVLPFDGEVGHTYAAGETVAYQITVTNTGTTAVSGVRVCESMEGSFAASAAGASDGAAVPTFTIARILPGESVSLTFAHVVRASEVPYRLPNGVQVRDGAGWSVGSATAVSGTGYRLRYFGNGATAGTAPETSYLLGSEKADIAHGGSLSRPGYAFLGWAEGPYSTTVSHMPGSKEALSGNLDLYAVWSPLPAPPAPPAPAPAPIVLYPPAAPAPTVVVEPSSTVVERVVEVERQAAESIAEGASPATGAGAPAPQGSWSLVSLVLAALALVLAALALAGLARRRDPEPMDDVDASNLRRQRAFGAAATAAGLLPAVLFVALDDLSQPMAMVTRSTVYVALAFVLAVALAAAYLALRRRRDGDETSDLYV